MPLSEINWLAALAGAALSYLLGALWFNEKVFGRAWMAAQPQRTNYDGAPRALMAEAVTAVLTAALVSWLLAAGGLPAVLLFAAALAAGYASGALFLAQPRALWMIPAAYALARIAVIVAAHAFL
ncbi:MAG: DUF1761 family protein [Gammaproteobacteria bacterium]